MDQVNRFSLCFRLPDGVMTPLYDGRATDRGLYAVAVLVSRFRTHFPEIALVVEGRLVRSAALTPAGLRLTSQPLIAREA